MVITDKNGTKVNRNDIASICNAPYTVVLTSTAGGLSTQYGDPHSTTFGGANATYLINPAGGPAVCFAKPDMTLATGAYAGPASMWNPTKGFIPQSTTPSSYGSNFPTTGANGLYFDLDIAGSSTALSWAPVTATVNGIKVTMQNATPTSVRVKLTGPTTAIPPSPFNTDGATFELEGKSGSTTVAKYGFTIKKWYVTGGTWKAPASSIYSWCTGLGYRQSKINDLTNASGSGWVGASPSSGGGYLMRHIDSGLLPEWGQLANYTGSNNGSDNYWTSEYQGVNSQYTVNIYGNVAPISIYLNYLGVCTYP